MNKLQRLQSSLKRAARLAYKCGWRKPFHELPEATRIALQSDGPIRRPMRNGRKYFGSCWGHRVASVSRDRHLDARALRERAEVRDSPTEEREMQGHGAALQRGTDE